MVEYCQGCCKEHDDYAWHFSREFEGWICSKHFKVTYKEIEPESIKEDRKKYFNAVVQPFRSGELSREYVEAHGTKGLSVTKEEVKKSKYVWKDLAGWSSRDKSK